MIELIWDSERQGTVVTPSGASASVGARAEYSPEDLAVMAAASGLMCELVDLAVAARIDLLSFTAIGEIEPNGACEAPRIHLRTFVVAQPAQAVECRDLVSLAVRTSPICRLFGHSLTVDQDVRALAVA